MPRDDETLPSSTAMTADHTPHAAKN
jgi:hypothetical protein